MNERPANLRLIESSIDERMMYRRNLEHKAYMHEMGERQLSEDEYHNTLLRYDNVSGLLNDMAVLEMGWC